MDFNDYVGSGRFESELGQSSGENIRKAPDISRSEFAAKLTGFTEQARSEILALYDLYANRSMARLGLLADQAGVRDDPDDPALIGHRKVADVSLRHGQQSLEGRAVRLECDRRRRHDPVEGPLDVEAFGDHPIPEIAGGQDARTDTGRDRAVDSAVPSPDSSPPLLA